MADVKGQIWRGTNPADAADQRKSTGALKGEAEGDHHRTLDKFEFRVPDGDVDMWLSRAKQFNTMVAEFTAQQPEMFGFVATALGLKGSGPVHFGFRVYDND